jgi:predicted transcriptional regulator
MKHFKKLEKTVRGFSNHRRIEILNLLHRNPELSVMEVAEALGINFKTASEHMRRLHIAELIWKRNEGNAVRHSLSSLGKSILMFLRTLE